MVFSQHSHKVSPKDLELTLISNYNGDLIYGSRRASFREACGIEP